MKQQEFLKHAWKKLYNGNYQTLLTEFLDYLENFKKSVTVNPHEPEWYKDVIVYSLYVDLFNGTFDGLKQKLNYLQDLGVNCLWLLPILDSPMRDAGFDIRQYTMIRHELLGLPQNATNDEKIKVFRDFLDEAHRRNINVIFDIAINHTSNQHPWFQESRKSPDNPYRDYYIWNKDKNLYKETRLIFKGMVPSNWEKDGDWYFFHRFFEFQPDLNYRNPQVLIEMSKNLLFWLRQGVDGFRADAIPYLWKEDGTDCENLPKTHIIVKFLRAALDFVRPNILLLAEACQKPVEVVKYFGDGNECNAGYHFPLMPQMFKAVAQQSNVPVQKTLSPEVTPEIPETCQWFTFLRCHDELSLELVYVSEEDRSFIHNFYCRDPKWDFRLGEGISARLAELMENNPDKIALIYSVMLTLPGTPIIYYGDEFGKKNDEKYYQEKIKETGKDDTRFLVRGKIDWEKLNKDLENKNSFSYLVFSKVSRQINVRKKFKAFGRGKLEWFDIFDDDKKNDSILTFIREFENERILILNNLSGKEQRIKLNEILKNLDLSFDLLGRKLNMNTEKTVLTLPPYFYHWILV